MQFDRHTLVLLVLRPDAPELTDEEAAELQDRHLAFRADLRDRGVLIAGGPRVDQDDERQRSSRSGPATPRRRAGSAAMTRWCKRAGSVEVMTWIVPAGNLSFDRVSAPRSLFEVAED